MRKINKIIVHCSATPEGREVTVEDITRWHRERGFSTIGYHYIIYLDGSVHLGRSLLEQGAHCTGQNKFSIGICYIGGLAKDGKTPKDTRTVAQKVSLIKLTNSLLRKYELKPDKVYGHNQFANKACPSFDINELRAELV